MCAFVDFADCYKVRHRMNELHMQLYQYYLRLLIV